MCAALVILTYEHGWYMVQSLHLLLYFRKKY